MVNLTEAIALIALAALCIIGVIILAAMQVAIPDVLSGIALAAVGGGAGVARQQFTNNRPKR